jgi:hypothetical protein
MPRVFNYIDFNPAGAIELLEQISAKQRSNELTSRLNQLKELVKGFPTFTEREDFDTLQRRIVQWVSRAGPILDGIDAALRELRRRSIVGPRSAT